MRIEQLLINSTETGPWDGLTGAGFVFEYLSQLKKWVFNCKTFSGVTPPRFQQGLLRTRTGFVDDYLYRRESGVFTSKTFSDVESPVLETLGPCK